MFPASATTTNFLPRINKKEDSTLKLLIPKKTEWENIELEGPRKIQTVSCPNCGKLNPEVNPYCVICKFKPLPVNKNLNLI